MIEPRVSVPIANATRPADVAAPGPADDPLELESGAQGLRVDPPNHTPPCASDPIDSFATSTAPASRSRSTTVASPSATRFSYGFAPNVVLIPLVSSRSFAPQGIPWSGPRYRPARISLSAFAACCSASSSVSVTTQWSRSPYFFRRPRYILVRSVDEIFLDSTSDASIVTGSNARSSSDAPTWTTLSPGAFAIASLALRVLLPLGCLPGRYGRNAIAGSVSSGTLSLRSSS